MMRLSGDEMFDAYREYRESAHDDDESGEESAGGREAGPAQEARSPEEVH